MTRVHERHVSAGPSAADRHRRTDQKRKASYKVILEEVADKQKRLKTVLYPEQKAPRGYTFIPAGDPQLTNRCKKLAREDGFTVFIVSTSKHLRQDLSREIHRVGFHFPSVTVEKACDSLGVTLSNSGRVLQSNFAHLEDGQEHDGRRPTKQKKSKIRTRNAQPALDISLPQAVIDTSARETIRDLFPNIPSQDLHLIVGRSFQKGKGLVGTVADLSLVRRAQLAVIAHIRHTYTNYDSLLKQVQYNEARRRVEKPCLDRLIQWRGDDDNAGDMDDVLREVIVIPDDDEELDEGDLMQETLRMRPHEIERDSSVEYISEADIQIQPVDYSNINRTVERGDCYSPESDQEVQYLGRNRLRHSQEVQYGQHILDRIGTHRQRVYEAALDRRRKHSENLNVYNDHSLLPVSASSGHNSTHQLSQQAQDRSHPPYLAERSRQTIGRAPRQNRLMPVARPEDYRADPYSNARFPKYVLEEQVAYSTQQDQHFHESLEQPKRIIYAEEDQSHNLETRPPGLRQIPSRVFDQEDRFVSHNDSRHHNSKILPTHDIDPASRQRSGMVLPSIERDLPDEQGNETSLHERTRQVNPFDSFQPLNLGTLHLAERSVMNLEDYEEPSSSKRRRIDYQQPVDSQSQGRTVLVPIAQVDDRRLQCERPHEFSYLGDTERFVSDKRIVPLPPKEERAIPPISYQEPQLFSPRTKTRKHPDLVADREEFDSPPRDHHRVRDSRSENVEILQSPSRAVFAPPAYYNNSPSFFDSSQFPPRHHERSDLGSSSSLGVGGVTDNDRVYADSDGVTCRLEPLEVAERSMPSRFGDMSIDCRQRNDKSRADRATYVPFNPAADSHRRTKPSPGSLTDSFATATDTVRGHPGHVIHPFTYGLDIAKKILREDMEPPTNAYPRDTRERRSAATNFDYPPSGMQQLPGVQQQPVYRQPNQLYAERDGANAFERRAPPSASRVAIERWDTNMLSRNRPLDGPTEGRPPHIGATAARPGYMPPVRREHDDFRPGQRMAPGDFVVLD